MSFHWRILVVTAAIILLEAGQGPTLARATMTEVHMSQGMKRELDTFFSNFSEVDVQPFAAGQVTDRQLVAFSIEHIHLNDYKAMQPAPNSKMRLSTAQVNRVAQRFFGRAVRRPQSFRNLCTYSNGFYVFDVGEGEVDTFSQIVQLSDKGNSRYDALINVYEAPNNFEGDAHGTMQEWQRLAPDERPNQTGKIRAIIQRVTNGGKPHYILLQYQKAD